MNLIDDIEVTNCGYQVTASSDFSEQYLTTDTLYVSSNTSFPTQLNRDVVSSAFVSIMFPAIWLSGNTWHVDTVDTDLYQWLCDIKPEFSNLFSHNDWDGSISYNSTKELKTVEDSPKKGILFSGGVDSTFTARTLQDKDTTLIGIGGIDTDLDGNVWDQRKQLIDRKAGKYGVESILLETNVMEIFDEDKIQEKVNSSHVNSWWGNVQHSFALSGITIPMMIEENINNLYFSASRSHGHGGKWASAPRITDSMNVSGISIENHGYDKTRQEKIQFISDYSPELLPVCNNKDIHSNCCSCCKCLCTAVALIISGEKPSDYGFNETSESILQQSKRQFQIYTMDIPNQGKLQKWKNIQKEIQRRDDIDHRFYKWFQEYDIEAYAERYRKKCMVKSGVADILEGTPVYSPIELLYHRIATTCKNHLLS